MQTTKIESESAESAGLAGWKHFRVLFCFHGSYKSGYFGKQKKYCNQQMTFAFFEDYVMKQLVVLFHGPWLLCLNA